MQVEFKTLDVIIARPGSSPLEETARVLVCWEILPVYTGLDGVRFTIERSLSPVFPAEDTETIRAKWVMDEATTLAEAAGKLRAFADGLDAMHAEGWRLERPVDDDYGFVLAPGEEPGDDEEDEALFEVDEAAATAKGDGLQAHWPDLFPSPASG